jgi:hypothetical protein
MSTDFLDSMANGLTAVHTRGMERTALTLGRAAADGTIPVERYDFTAYERRYGQAPDSPRYLLAVRQDIAQSVTLHVWFARDADRETAEGHEEHEEREEDEEHLTLHIPAGWPAGHQLALPIPGRAGEITHRLRLRRIRPSPPTALPADAWQVTVLLGNLVKLLWSAGREHQELTYHQSDVAAQRIASAAHGASLDLLGSDQGAPRFPPRPYAWDEDTIALYHLDDRPQPGEPEVTTVTDEGSHRRPPGHPGTNHGALSSRTGRFSDAFEFTKNGSEFTEAEGEEGVSISIPHSTAFDLAAGAAFTVEAVIRPDPGGTGTGAVVAKRSPLNTTEGTGWALTVGSFRNIDRNVRFSISDGSRQIELFADRDLGDGAFHHIAGVIGHSPESATPSVAQLYVDGVEAARCPLDVPLGPVGTPVPIRFAFGKEELADGQLYNAQFVGLLEEVRISRCARRSFHPVTGEDDGHYRTRLGIFQRWLLPTPSTLQTAINTTAGPVVTGDPPRPVADAFEVREATDPVVTGTRTLRVIPPALTQSQSIAADGAQNVPQADAVGTADDEPDFDPAWLCRHEDHVGLDFGGREDNRWMQQTVRVALNALLDRLDGERAPLRVVRAYDAAADDLHRVGRALLLDHGTLTPDELGVHAHAAGFGWVGHTREGPIHVAQPRGEAFRITPAASPFPKAPDVVEQQELALSVDPDPTRLPGTTVRWSVIQSGAGKATIPEYGPGRLRTTAAGDVSVRVEVTRDGHTRDGSRTIRIGLSDTSLRSGESIGGSGQRGLSEEEAAGGPTEDFRPVFLLLRTDDQHGLHPQISYGTEPDHRRMQRVTAKALDRLLDLLAGSSSSGQLVVHKAYDPQGPGLHEQGRALRLSHSELPGPALAARAFAADFDFIRVLPANAPEAAEKEEAAQAADGATVHVAVAPGELIEVHGPGEITVGQWDQVAAEPRPAPAEVCFSVDGDRLYVSDPGGRRITSLTLAAEAGDQPPGVTDERSTEVPPFPGALAVAGGRLYVAHEALDLVSTRDAVTLAAVGQGITGPGPVALATHGERLFVAYAGDATLRAYDDTGEERGRSDLPETPRFIAPVPGRQLLYVGLNEGMLCEIDPGPVEILRTVALGATEARSAAATADGAELYVACGTDDAREPSGAVHVLRTQDHEVVDVITDFPAGELPTRVVMGTDQRSLYVATAATGGPAAKAGRIRIVDIDAHVIRWQVFAADDDCPGLATSPAGADYRPCLAAACQRAGSVLLADPTPLAEPSPRPPALLSRVPMTLGSPGDEQLVWSSEPAGRGCLGLASDDQPASRITGIAPGVAVLRGSYLRGGGLRPYQFEVALRPELDARTDTTITKEQYDLVLNILNWFHPIGVEFLTSRLRAHVPESDLDPFALPDYTFPTYRLMDVHPPKFKRRKLSDDHE